MLTSVAIPVATYRKGDFVLLTGHGWYGGKVLRATFEYVEVFWEDGQTNKVQYDAIEHDTTGYGEKGWNIDRISGRCV